MIRFTWLQARVQVLIVAVVMAAGAVLLVVTGAHLAHLYDQTVAACAHGDCGASSNFAQNDRTLQSILNLVVIIVPALLGLFWGAPLVAHELETGVFRMVWTQSVTRRRWLASNLALFGLASMAVAGLVSLMVTWWSSPLDRSVFGSPFSTFDSRGVVAIGYAAFAFALGAVAGVCLRRSLPAMAATLGAFIAVRLVMTFVVRPHLLPALHKTLPLNTQTVNGFGSSNGGPPTLFTGTTNPRDWVYSTQIVDRSGHVLTSAKLQTLCPSLFSFNGPSGPATSGASPVPVKGGGGPDPLQSCIQAVSVQYHEIVSYQSANRYWPFQFIELAIYLGAAVALCGLCVWLVRKRLT